jgi:hypothetical protein
MNLVATEASRVDCSWCGTTIREGSEPISHGMCVRCSESWAPVPLEPEIPGVFVPIGRTT